MRGGNIDETLLGWMLVEAIKSPKIVARMENNAPIGSCIKLYMNKTHAYR
jgi:hypothetical protein